MKYSLIFLMIVQLLSWPVFAHEQGNDTARYFLSKVKLIKHQYIPTFITCLTDAKENEVYHRWSAIYSPLEPPYEVVLIRIQLKETVVLNDSCFIKEIKSGEDWQEVKLKYNFSQERFGKSGEL